MYSVFAELLTKKGVKASDVCKATGINSTFFSEWKKGKNNPKQDKLEKIADYFGVSVEYLRTGKDNRVPVPHFDPRHIDLITDFEKLNEEKKKYIMDLIKMLIN